MPWSSINFTCGKVLIKSFDFTCSCDYMLTEAALLRPEKQTLPTCFDVLLLYMFCQMKVFYDVPSCFIKVSLWDLSIAQRTPCVIICCFNVAGLTPFSRSQGGRGRWSASQQCRGEGGDTPWMSHSCTATTTFHAQLTSKCILLYPAHVHVFGLWGEVEVPGKDPRRRSDGEASTFSACSSLFCVLQGSI